MRFSNNAASLSKPTGLGFLVVETLDSKLEFVVCRAFAAIARGAVMCHPVGVTAGSLPRRGADRPGCPRPWHPWTRLLLTVTCFLACPGLLAGAAAADGERAADGLRLTYEVSFGSIPVGRSYYSWVPDGETTWVTKELAPSGPMARLYRVKDRFVARVRGRDGRPELLYEDIDEPRGRRQERWSIADWARGATTVVRVNHADNTTDRDVLPVPPGMQWPLTLPYWIALQPTAALDGLAVPLLDGTKLKEVRLHVVGEEKVKTDIGKLACDLLQGEVWYRGERQRAGSFEAWRRRTAPHIPVRIFSRLKFGTLRETVVLEEAYGERPDIPACPIDSRDQ